MGRDLSCPTLINYKDKKHASSTAKAVPESEKNHGNQKKIRRPEVEGKAQGGGGSSKD